MPKENNIMREYFGAENVGLKLKEILTNDWYQNSEIVEIVKPILTRFCAQYLLEERKGDRALDPVANFHLSNGASAYQLGAVPAVAPLCRARLAGPG